MVSAHTFTAVVPKEIEEAPGYVDWEDSVDGSQFRKIEIAKTQIIREGLVSNTKNLGHGLYEKKWNNGLRLYFAIILQYDGSKTLLLLGSGKGREQGIAIRRAYEVLSDYKVVRENIKR